MFNIAFPLKSYYIPIKIPLDFHDNYTYWHIYILIFKSWITIAPPLTLHLPYLKKTRWQEANLSFNLEDELFYKAEKKKIEPLWLDPICFYLWWKEMGALHNILSQTPWRMLCGFFDQQIWGSCFPDVFM